MDSDEDEFEKEQKMEWDQKMIVGVWLESKIRIKDFDEKLCAQCGLDYHTFVEKQRKSFQKFVEELTYFRLSKYSDEIFFKNGPGNGTTYSNLKKSFMPFQRKENLQDPIVPTVDRNKLIHALSIAFEELTGEEYHAELLVDMFQIENYEQLGSLTFIDIMHLEILDLNKIREVLAVLKILSSSRLTSLLGKILHPYDPAVLALLGYKHDKECSLRVFPKDIMLKIAHQSSGTNPIGKTFH